MNALRIHPLPDFLADHTLLAADLAGRLQEHTRRWTQFVRSLWSWRDRAGFCLRYAARPGDDEVRVSIAGRAFDPADQPQVDIDLRLRLAAFGIPVTPDAAAAEPIPVRLEVRQRLDREIWTPSNTNPALTVGGGLHRGNVGGLTAADQLKPPVVFPWRGPGGTFQLPVAALLGLGVAAELTVYLQPTRLSKIERDFLRFAAAEAESKGKTSSAMGGGTSNVTHADPAADLAAKLYVAQYRRWANPFLVAVQFAAPTEAAARSLAAALEAVVLEPPLDVQDPEEARLPPGADVEVPTPGTAALPQTFRFDVSKATLDRLTYLADAAGAATAFRLPVSVNGGVPGIVTRQQNPGFHPGPRRTIVDHDDLILGDYDDGGLATMPMTDLTKHALVTGFTGSGKTVTVLRLLHQLWDRPLATRVPFLVLESAKQEYRGLFGVPAIGKDLRVYTLGNERGVPFRLNPFELLPGVRVEAHVARLQVCFEAAIPPVGPSASVIAESLVRVYEDAGWQIDEIYPDPTKSVPRRPFPTLSAFATMVERVIKDRKYEGEVLGNVTAALVGRLKPLLLGSKGRMFDCQRSAPSAAKLFRWPTVLEMNDLNVDDKALVVMFVLTLLREHRDLDRGTPGIVGRLKHVTLVEEAHNVLAEVSSSGGGEGAGADTRFKAVEAFCTLLTEVRALGEGLIIADQSPEKLARDAMRNTNLQIAHQLRDGRDRDAMANAMIMTDEQRDFLGKLRPGHAAHFRTGLERATFVQVRKYYPDEDDLKKQPADAAAKARYRAGFDGWGFDATLTDEAILRLMQQREQGLPQRLSLPFAGCDHCEVKATCPHRDALWPEFQGKGRGVQDVATWRNLLAKNTPFDTLWRQVAQASRAGGERVRQDGVPQPPAVEWCYLVHMWDASYGRDSKHMLTKDHLKYLTNALKETTL